ncbi:MAG: hypothetical protein LBV40_02380 [Methanomicrobiales archaeon]|jgi:hypothetical protein|nr:hypothetical protein [Methanomicrobiales archaeon]
MNPNRLRILIILIPLALIILSILLVPAGELPFQPILVFLIVAAAVLLASLFSITRRQLMKGYVVMGIGMIGVAILVAILFYFQGDSGGYAEIYEAGVSGLITGGIVLSLIGGIKLRKGPDSDIQDERTKKIGSWGITYSWYITYLFVAFALFASILGLPVPSMDVFLWLIIIIMPVSALIFQSYFFHRGDIDP